MSWEQVASGNLLDSGELGGIEDNTIEEGRRAMIQIDTIATIPGWVTSKLQAQLNQHGVEEAVVSASGKTLQISYRKGFAWLPVIVALVLVLAIIVVAWRFFREIISNIPDIFKGPAAIALIGAVVLGVVVLAGSKRK